MDFFDSPSSSSNFSPKMAATIYRQMIFKRSLLIQLQIIAPLVEALGFFYPTTNFGFIRLCQGNPSFGTDVGGSTDAFIIPGLTAGGGGKGGAKNAADGIIPVLDINTVFGFEYGLRLFKGTNNRLVFEINDDLTTGLGLNADMNVIAYGFERKFD